MEQIHEAAARSWAWHCRASAHSCIHALSGQVPERGRALPQNALGFDGDPRATLKARVIRRKLHPGNIRLVADADGGLWAEYDLAPGALLLKEGQVVAGARFGNCLLSLSRRK